MEGIRNELRLVADGLHRHIPRGDTYFAIGFSIFVEMLNLKAAAAASSSRSCREPSRAARTK
jgi:hypothetical protein